MLELEHGFRVVDTHATLEPDEDASRRGRAVKPERLERELRQAGVVRAVVVPDDRAEGYLAANNAVARLCVERPFVAFARLSGPRDPSSRLRSLTARDRDWHTTPGEVEQYAYDDRFGGFALDPALDGLPKDDVLTALADGGLPVLVVGRRGFPPARVAETLLQYGFPTVLAHFGGHPLDRKLMRAAIDLLDSYENLHLETSTVRYREPLQRAMWEHPDRVLFGSGAPGVHPSVAVMELLTLSVPEDAMRRAFDANPSRVIPALAP